jgi:hypothetical protein
MDAPRDQQRCWTVDKRRHACGVLADQDDHPAHAAAFPKINQYVVAESPSSWSLRNVRMACGIVSKQDRKAPVQARIVTITGAPPSAYGPLVGRGCDCSPSR